CDVATRRTAGVQRRQPAQSATADQSPKRGRPCHRKTRVQTGGQTSQRQGIRRRDRRANHHRTNLGGSPPVRLCPFWCPAAWVCVAPAGRLGARFEPRAAPIKSSRPCPPQRSPPPLWHSHPRQPVQAPPLSQKSL